MTQKATAAEGTTPVLTKQVTDLSIGDVIAISEARRNLAILRAVDRRSSQ